MGKWMQGNAVVALVMCLFALTACDKIVDSSRAVQTVTKSAFDDTKSSWRDFFMYHPPVPESLPQTRYCYQMQSDVVCYDSEQRQLTSKLVGYQDGENISWVQPGGGSLGASGGVPVALRPIPERTTRVAVQPSESVTQAAYATGPLEAPAVNTTAREAWEYDKKSDIYSKATVAAPDVVNVTELPKAK
jgi:hypothetical protein